MIDTRIIDGKAFAERLRADITARVAALKNEHGITPGLAVILVGSDAASQVYVKNKQRQTLAAGMHSYHFSLPETTSQAELLETITQLNQDPKIHGILVQLPLPRHLSESAVIDAIHPDKDVDGFHVVNAGKLTTGQPGFIPCTPLGCLMLLKEYSPSLTLSPLGGGDLKGKHAVVIGRSNIVGKPMAQLLLRDDCTVTIAHSKTKDLPALLKTADIVVAAVGKPHLVKGDWLKSGAVVIDVGINRIASPDGKTRLVGDVDFDSCLGVAGAITPVPGGVGPMTIACLLENTLRAANK